MKTKLLGQSLVDVPFSIKNNKTFKAFNPQSGTEMEPLFHSLSIDLVDAIASKAAEAYTLYSKTSNADRAAFLRMIADEIDSVADDLVERTCLETALPESRIRGETARTTGQLQLFAKVVEDGSWLDARIERAQPGRVPLPKPDIRSMLVPLGPVAVFGASNFPLAFSVAGGDTASALAAGCPVIVKAHVSHPGTSEIVGHAVMRAARSCGMPDGVFSLLFDEDIEVGTALVEHPAVRAVGFTGSRSGGTALMKIAAARAQPIPVFAEMSSINPVVYCADAISSETEVKAEALFGSLTMGMGQFCTNPGLVFVPAGKDADTFVAKLAALAGSDEGGYLLNPSIAKAYKHAVKKRSEQSNIEKPAVTSDNDSEGCHVQSTVYRISAADFIANELFREEVFGPSATIVTYSGIDELKASLAALEGQLTGTIQATDTDIPFVRCFLSEFQEKVGRIIFNGFPTGVEVCHAMVHGGPYPATSDGRSTSVGTMAILRFVRPVAFQNVPDALLPKALDNMNSLGIERFEK